MKTSQNVAKNLQKKLGIKNNIYLKREDLHPYHSHKGRSIPQMIDKHHNDGWSNFCISSSGNAGLAAILYIKDYNTKNNDKLNLKVFVGNNIDKDKLQILNSTLNECDNISIEQVERPKQKAFQLDKEGKVKFLRQSTDEYAIDGYYELAKELSEIQDLTAIFIPTSSGTTASGLYQGFQILKINPQIHIIQTDQCHALVSDNSINSTKESSLASAIVDKIGHRKKEVQKLLKVTNGHGWIANNEDIQNAINIVKETENLNISANSALSIVGLIKAIEKQHDLNGSVVCLITGK